MQPITEGLGLTLWDVRFEKEGASWYLRIFIDKEGGIEIADCEAVNRPLNKLLDDTDPIEQSYVLEVSSPGLGRELRSEEHLAFAMGRAVRVRLFREQGGVREFVGTLTSFDKESIALDTNGENKQFRLADCAYVRLNDDNELF